MSIEHLNQNFISQNLFCPAGKTRIEVCDRDLPGLYVEVRATNQGQGTWYLRFKDRAGKTCHQKLGRTTDLSLAEARKKAKALKAEIALGADPRGEEKARKEVVTLTELYTQFYAPFVKPRKRSWKRDEELYRLRLQKPFGDRQISTLKRQEIAAWHTSLLGESLRPATVDHALKLLKHMLFVAADFDLLSGPNPAARIPMLNIDNAVNNYMDQAQLTRLLTVLHTDQNRPVCLVALFLLSTGARLNEALQATWDQIDRPNRVWRIPAANSKSKRGRTCVLNDSALTVLTQLDPEGKHETEGKDEHIFIGQRRGTRLKSIKRVWSRLRNLAGLPHLRLHDLRHQWASHLINSGRSLYEVQTLLSHRDPKTTMRYSHSSTKTLQEAANTASIKLLEAMSEAEVQTEVVPASVEPKAA
jgi:integrase